jgi:uncharacterized protein with HEPN domain
MKIPIIVKTSDEQKPSDAHPEIPWRMIIALRNRLIHGYLGIDNDMLWSIIQDDVPDLLPFLNLMTNEAQS